MAASAQLLVYGFEPGAEFEGRLLTAIERIESGGRLQVLDVLFVAVTDELVAITRRGRGEGSLVGPLVDFRLDPGERRRVSAEAFREDAHGDALRRMGEALEPGAAVAGVLIAHVWMEALDDAVSRTGGKPLASELVDAAGLDELLADVIVAAGRRGEIGS